MDRLEDVIQPLRGAPGEFDALVDRLAEARLVLIGEASHGTHDFYQIRSHLTKRLIAERDFAGVAAEADWPDAYRVNGYVRGRHERPLGDGRFKRLPPLSAMDVAQ